MDKFNQLNKKIAVRITGVVGSMYCAYLFAIIALISFPAAISSGSVIIIIDWVAQTFLQLILLSIIIAGQDIQGAKSDERTEKTLQHISDDNNRILSELKELLAKNRNS
jgi:hypothetical protein